jgi:molybdopterin-guanine dinucleotide biosynthesis protein A
LHNYHHFNITQSDRESFIEYDFVLFDDYLTSSLPKIVLLDSSLQLTSSIREKERSNIVALVGVESSAPDWFKSPYFQRDEIENIADFIVSYFKELAANISFKAAIMIGGKSSRMGEDKSQISYHGVPQGEYLYKLLMPLVEEVVVSCRRQQQSYDWLVGKTVVTDIYENQGPMGGILSLFNYDPQVYWMVIGCDMPNLTQDDFKVLKRSLNPFRMITSYSLHDRLEPLCAIYSPKSHIL